MYWLMGNHALQRDWVPPFGYPRIVACVRLPEAFRRFLRPSSALYAKTSTVRSFSFNHYLLSLLMLLRELYSSFFTLRIDFVLIFSFLQLLRKTYLSFFCYSVFKELLRETFLQISQNQTGISHTFRENVFSYIFLLRKEVIHPHVLVGIPCYDLTPITSPTFDGSLPCGLGHRLRVLPALMV